MISTPPGSDSVIVKRTLYDNGKEPPVVIYASINKTEAIPGEPVFSGKFISYGRRPGNVYGKIIELWQKIYIGDNEPGSAPYVP